MRSELTLSFCVSTNLKGAFPQENVAVSSSGGLALDEPVPQVPLFLAYMFHCMNGISLLMQLMLTISWTGGLMVTSSVSSLHFSKYMYQIEWAFCRLLVLSEFASVCFVINVGTLFSAMIFSTTTNPLILNTVGLPLPAIVIIPLFLFLHEVMGFMSQAAFNGLLMSDTLPDPQSMDNRSQDPGEAAEGALDRLYDDYCKHEIKDKVLVLDLYTKGSQSRSKLGAYSFWKRRSSTISPPLLDFGQHLVQENALPRFHGSSMGTPFAPTVQFADEVQIPSSDEFL